MAETWYVRYQPDNKTVHIAHEDVSVGTLSRRLVTGCETWFKWFVGECQVSSRTLWPGVRVCKRCLRRDAKHKAEVELGRAVAEQEKGEGE